MLVLTRKTQQQIQIGNNIVVTILQVKGQSVRVGIEAPRDVRVVRSELSDTVPTVETEVEPAPLAPKSTSSRSSRTARNVMRQVDRFFPQEYMRNAAAPGSMRDHVARRKNVPAAV